ncbi:hypothetical protein [Shewanella halotolerans]|uniref:hypothetical protein n=1 Tax=Shewanella halotolerans TaxID=2864204 RepID=UPI001C660E96|nr:hypothetical protein [Shewanella halotolerans]QYJ88233.1 hypothetical protein K0H81_10355 [Shewanella halotolerans]
MSKKLFAGVLLTLASTACSSTQNTPGNSDSVNNSLLAANLLEVSGDNLSDYWQPKSKKTVMLKSRPKWIPKGMGQFSYHVVIDSEGNEVSKTLVSSSPEGWMTQARLNKMPKVRYLASDDNPEHLPVKALLTSKVMPRHLIESEQQ